jgi:leucyl aminopeptidase
MRLPLNLVAVAAAVENMPDGNAYRPSDVLTSDVGPDHRSAQHRRRGPPDPVRRADLCRSASSPTRVIDVATLTGACVVALGKHRHRPDDQARRPRGELLAAGEPRFDRAWQLPLWDEYQPARIRPSPMSTTSAASYAGAITAGCFLSRFTEGQRWAPPRHRRR